MTKHGTVVAVMVLLTRPAVFAAERDECPSLAVRLFDDAGLPEEIRLAAEQQVERIYLTVGVRLVWVGALDARVSGRPLDIVLLSAAMTERELRGGKGSPLDFGRASHEARQAHIYTDRIVTSATRARADVGASLGLIIAHELGHLLLPGYPHSHSGIMQAGHDFRGRVPLRFTGAEAKAIQHRVCVERDQ